MKKPPRTRDRLLNAETKEEPKLSQRNAADHRVAALTILWHPDVKRIGERAKLFAAEDGGEVALARTQPDFSKPREEDQWPLADPFVSRKPAVIRRAGAGLTLTRDQDAVKINADGEAVGASVAWSNEQLSKGVVLEVGLRIVLLLHDLPATDDDPPDLGFSGENEVMNQLRRSILRVADMPVAVLLRGETGTGKELVARAVHAASSRSASPCHAINMAAIAASVAPSELFGHAKGAFTGAVQEHDGLFLRANRGTLFLDEIAECSVEVQVMLLRVLETKHLRPVGGTTDVEVDVRLIAATDADLEDAVSSGRFRAPLLHRLAGYELHLPPLRDRRDDLGRLFARFLGEELALIGEQGRLEAMAEAESPWIPASLVGRLARYDWPGNVRQLKNVARQLVVSNVSRAVMELDKSVERLLAPKVEAQKPEAAKSGRAGEKASEKEGRRKPSEVTEEELLETLRKNRFRLEPTATDLRISRASLYMLIEKSKRLRKASDIPKDELEREYAEAGGDVDRMAEKLEVSGRGLYLRLKETGVIPRA